MTRRRPSDLADIRARPTYVYQAYCEHNGLLYVGVAADVERRLKQHKATKDWWKDAELVIADCYADRATALAEEARVIRHWFPAHNIKGTSVLRTRCDTSVAEPLPGTFLSFDPRVEI